MILITATDIRKLISEFSFTSISSPVRERERIYGIQPDEICFSG
jgi:hypothetical protein